MCVRVSDMPDYASNCRHSEQTSMTVSPELAAPQIRNSLAVSLFPEEKKKKVMA